MDIYHLHHCHWERSHLSSKFPDTLQRNHSPGTHRCLGYILAVVVKLLAHQHLWLMKGPEKQNMFLLNPHSLYLGRSSGLCFLNLFFLCVCQYWSVLKGGGIDTRAYGLGDGAAILLPFRAEFCAAQKWSSVLKSQKCFSKYGNAALSICPANHSICFPLFCKKIDSSSTNMTMKAAITDTDFEID